MKKYPFNLKFLIKHFIKNFSEKYKKLALREKKQLNCVRKTPYSKKYEIDFSV